jgi:peroxiredoxin Q/BCP
VSETEIRLDKGDVAPSFTLSNQDGDAVSLADYQGKKVILYFYPAASTPGCTTQACDFRDNVNSLASAGYQVLGLSKDDLPALQKFKSKQAINFPLLSDPEREVHVAYGAYGLKSLYGKLIQGTRRSTFVIDEDGVIQLALYNVKATGHVAMLRKKLGIDTAA